MRTDSDLVGGVALYPKSGRSRVGGAPLLQTLAGGGGVAPGSRPQGPTIGWAGVMGRVFKTLTSQVKWHVFTILGQSAKEKGFKTEYTHLANVSVFKYLK